jgi:hypothetical protein
MPPPLVWPEGSVVKGRVVDHKGVAVANAEVLLLDQDRIIVDAKRRTWFVSDKIKDPPDLLSTRTNPNGEFRIEQKKGTADRLAVIADDPLFWVVARKNLARGDNVEIKLPPAGTLSIHCNLPGKAAKQPVMIQLRSFDGMDWETDILRLHMSEYSLTNPGETVFEHLPPGEYAVERYQETNVAKYQVLMTNADRQLVKIDPDKRATIRIERKVGRPLTGQVRGLENIDLRYAHVGIYYSGPEEVHGSDGRRSRQMTAFDEIPIKSDGRFTTDPIPPGKYYLYLFAVRASTLEHPNQDSDFTGHLEFTVPEQGEMPKVEVVEKAGADKQRTPNTDYRARVVDDGGGPVATAQATIYGAWNWKDSAAGVIGIGNPGDPRFFGDENALTVLVRADGYAPAIARFKSEQRSQLQRGEATITMQRGQKVELQFHLPEGLDWPKGVLPEVCFSDCEEKVRIMRQPENRRQREAIVDFNIFNVRPIGEGRFEFQLAQETPPFHVAIHTPGFLQFFESGPFALADVKDGILTIDVPRPASLDIRFDPTTSKPDDLPFKGVSMGVMRQLRGDEYLSVARDSAASIRHELRLADLAPAPISLALAHNPGRKASNCPTPKSIPGRSTVRKMLLWKQGKQKACGFATLLSTRTPVAGSGRPCCASGCPTARRPKAGA